MKNILNIKKRINMFLKYKTIVNRLAFIFYTYNLKLFFEFFQFIIYYI